MLGGPAWLALEAKYLDRARSFYETFLDLEVRGEGEREVVLAAGDTDLVLRAPGDVPRGGLHTHYALSVPEASYGDWYARLDERFDLVEHEFGSARSLYLYDPDGNCVELGERTVDSGAGGGGGPTGLFEVVLEVEDLERAVHFYRTLGFEETDRGGDRRRVRMTTGDLDIELWEPQLGLADARGGVHVDLGLRARDLATTVDRVQGLAAAVTDPPAGPRIRDQDGHWLTLVPAD